MSAPDSTTETYVAVKFEIDSWRWAGVPWLLRTGKSLAMTATEAVVMFNNPPRLLFTAEGSPDPSPNFLRFRLGKNDGIMLHLHDKPTTRAVPTMIPKYLIPAAVALDHLHACPRK